MSTELEIEKMRCSTNRKFKFSMMEAFGAVDINNDTFIDKEDVS
jgi:hypothetical protein